MDEIKAKNIIEKGEHIHIYIPAYRFYLFAFFLLLGALVLVGSNVFIYLYEPEAFSSLWIRESLIYLGVMALSLLFMGYEFIQLKRCFKSPQMLICKNEIRFKIKDKGGPLLTSDYVSLKYKDIISVIYPPERDCSRTLTFLTETQRYPVGLILETEEKKIVYRILQSRLTSNARTVNED